MRHDRRAAVELLLVESRETLVAGSSLLQLGLAQHILDTGIAGGRALLDQLKDGGRLVAVVDAGPVGKATLWRRLGEGFDSRAAFDASAPPLPGFERAPVFAL